jgi:hypothetical protein
MYLIDDGTIWHLVTHSHDDAWLTNTSSGSVEKRSLMMFNPNEHFPKALRDNVLRI